MRALCPIDQSAIVATKVRNAVSDVASVWSAVLAMDPKCVAMMDGPVKAEGPPSMIVTRA